uniref:Retinoschisin n=1 Tax=Zeugodacus cucurbitae TaxID=28588 RepID=A0A0A1WSD1_ZEUCU
MALFAFDHLTQKYFNPNVLVGNWFEERCDRMVDKKAIVPGIYGSSNCPAEHSLYVETYQQPTPEKLNYLEYKRQAFVNRLNSTDTHFRTKDSEEFLKNMTTTSDVMYNIRPAKARAEAASGQKLLEKTEEMLSNYNQPTKTGIIHRLNCDRVREASTCDRTTYANDYQSKRIESREERCMLERCRKYKKTMPFYTEE